MVDTAASPAEVDAIAAVLTGAGIENRSEASARMQGDGPWLVMLVVLAVPFLNGFGGEAGKDAWQALKRLVADLHKARARESWGQVVIRPGVIGEDEADGKVTLPGFPIPKNPNVEITLDSRMPDEAYRALFDLDLDAFDGGTLHWNPTTGEWQQHGGLSDQ